MFTDTEASNPGRVNLSDKKWEKMMDICQAKARINKRKNLIREYMWFGDVQPAVVVSLNPLKIAVYSDEMDAVVIQTFPNELINIYHLEEGYRLISTNVYYVVGNIAEDIYVGEKYQNRYVDFLPTIVDFLSFDKEIIEQHKENITEETWKYVYDLGIKHINNYPFAREGFTSYQNVGISSKKINNKLIIYISIIVNIITLVAGVLYDSFWGLIGALGFMALSCLSFFIYYLIIR